MGEKINFNNCLFFSSTAFARNIGKLAEEMFSTTGMSSSHAFLLLLTVSEPGVQQKEVAERLQLTASTITRLLDKLEHSGYIRRETEGKNVFIHPTEKGIAKEDDLKKAWMSIYEKYTELLGPDLSVGLKHLINEANRKLQ